MELFPGVILWLFPDLERGGCLSDVSGQTFIFTPIDSRVASKFDALPFQETRVYAKGFFPEPGRICSFSIEFDEAFGRCGYRVTSIGPLAEQDAEIQDYETLRRFYKEHERKHAEKRGVGPRTRMYDRR